MHVSRSGGGPILFPQFSAVFETPGSDKITLFTVIHGRFGRIPKEDPNVNLLASPWPVCKMWATWPSPRRKGHDGRGEVSCDAVFFKPAWILLDPSQHNWD